MRSFTVSSRSCWDSAHIFSAAAARSSERINPCRTGSLSRCGLLRSATEALRNPGTRRFSLSSSVWNERLASGEALPREFRTRLTMFPVYSSFIHANRARIPKAVGASVCLSFMASSPYIREIGLPLHYILTCSGCGRGTRPGVIGFLRTALHKVSAKLIQVPHPQSHVRKKFRRLLPSPRIFKVI